ncbi:DegT/DnrJ/EryC1/StrS family aminotransferase [Mariprofundus sp. NF]|uniref:DegT/DnrJ/EryC1/StrS family aminotransferase n=1 Tax=Mariprofundus sp. NF TaxID=2608716 RepID=UPI00159F723E|nr:DegT/DnrJ/EryC1/StrS family aminotransferase [Mariprofundus sp. NF]NWF37929.1 DegT/DnrJ/EryC1/StrS family aminotransferase [Mariprofundus sp. NF]
MFGGSPAVKHELKRYNVIGGEELEAAKSVIETGVLSQFLGCWDEDFYGGSKIRAFEHAWRQYFNAEHAVTVNSNTSGLMASLGALGLEPGDEVIVSPWTMCASATSILVWNAIPVFADIEADTFNLDPVSIEKNISKKTKAIMVTDIFGHPAMLDEIMAIAARNNLKVIEDVAQAPGAYYKGRFAGTVADVGVFSLNYHKHIHTGEGGVCVTNDASLAERMQLIRNHAEAVVEDKGVDNLVNMLGFNFRMGEIEAAIGIEQLKKLDKQVNRSIYVADRMSEGLAGLKGLRTPVVKSDCTHVYYVYPLVYDAELTGVSRTRLVEVLSAEGVSISGGYQNVHLLPIFQKKIAYGSRGFPWRMDGEESDVSYDKGICPVAEKLHDESFLCLPMCLYEFTDEDVDSVIEAFHKVWRHMDGI